MSDNLDLAQQNGLNMEALGGTELMYRSLYEKLPRELLKKFQIFPSRVSVPLDQNRIRILWVHDMPGDPMYDHLKNGGWQKFHKIVFVSNYQMNFFVQYYKIPYEHCVVHLNAIEPIKQHEKPTDKINLAYWSTPQRGLNILIPVFERISEKFPDVELYVHSSFGLYNQLQMDEQFKPLIDKIKTNPKIHYQAPIDQGMLRHNLNFYHILAYPCTWHETSCRVLMEAMSAGLLPVIPNLAALSETAANFANMYQFHELPGKHAAIFHSALMASIEGYKHDSVKARLQLQKVYADVFYTWPKRIQEWTALLKSMENITPQKPEESKQFFEYRS
jgi:UDP-glucose:(glucosyl)LPS alpha-1,2-glucosyltransferase